MDKKTTGIISYLTIVGWVVALAAGEKSEYATFHINQALVLMIGMVIASVLYGLPIIGTFILGPIASMFVFVLWIIAFIGACQGEMKEAPLIGKIKIMK